jgi:hypothetical protein
MRAESRAFRILVPMTALVTALALPPASASAATESKDQCKAGLVCVFEHDDWKGCYSWLTAEDTDWGNGSPWWVDCDVTKKSVEDTVSSYVNNSDNWVGFWKEKNRRGGFALCVSPHGSSNDLNNLRRFGYPSFEDRISSHYTFGPERPSFMYPDGDGYCETYDEN